MLTFILNGKVVTGTKIEPIWKECLHIDSDSSVMTDPDRVFIELETDTKALKISGYPYKRISINKMHIVPPNKD